MEPDDEDTSNRYDKFGVFEKMCIGQMWENCKKQWGIKLQNVNEVCCNGTHSKPWQC